MFSSMYGIIPILYLEQIVIHEVAEIFHFVMNHAE
jgi:hypothetical protein